MCIRTLPRYEMLLRFFEHKAHGAVRGGTLRIPAQHNGQQKPASSTLQKSGCNVRLLSRQE